MLTFQDARNIAVAAINKTPAIGDNSGFTIIDSATLEKPYAWIFNYNSRLFLETGDLKYALGGNAPLFISKIDGKISIFQTGLSIDGMIDKYEEEEHIWQLALTDNIYSDNQKLIYLKQALNLSNNDIAKYKSSNTLVVATGAMTRLLSLQIGFTEKSILTQIYQRDLV